MNFNGKNALLRVDFLGNRLLSAKLVTAFHIEIGKTEMGVSPHFSILYIVCLFYFRHFAESTENPLYLIIFKNNLEFRPINSATILLQYIQ